MIELNHIRWSFASMGCLSLDKRIKSVFNQAGIQDVGISLLGGQMIDIKKTVQLYREHNLKTYSGDLPDLNWNKSRLCYDWKMINKMRPSWLDLSPSRWAKYLMMMIFQFTVWRLYGGIASEKALIDKMNDFYQATETIGRHKWMRWDSRSVLESAHLFGQLIKDNRFGGTEKVMLVVEYYPESGEPIYFYNQIARMRQEYPSLIVKISFDPTHYWRSRNLFPEMAEYRPEEYLYCILLDREKANDLAMLEVSNISTSGQVAHDTLYGAVDYGQIMALIGESIRVNRISLPFQIVLELGPGMIWPFLKKGVSMLCRWQECLTDESLFNRAVNDIKSRASFEKLKNKF